MIYKIGNVYIEWLDTNFKIRNDEFMKKFEVNEIKSLDCQKITFRTEVRDMSFVTKYPLLNKSSSSELYETERGKLMIYHWAMCRFGIGYWMEDLDKDEIICYFHPEMEKQVPVDASWFFSIAGLHRILLQKQHAVLHASCILWKEKTIVFTAPSQTGKSTQSRLWVGYEEAKIINDDRILLGKDVLQWKSYGYPSCGSSKICVNETAPIGVIVILEQGKDNRVEELSYFEKIKALVSGIEVYRWQLDEIDMSINCAGQIVQEVPMVKLVCRPDQEAVEVLRSYLQEKGW